VPVNSVPARRDDRAPGEYSYVMRWAAYEIFRVVFLGLATMLVSSNIAVAQLADRFVQLGATALKPGAQATLEVGIDMPRGYHAQSHTPTSPDFIKFDVQMEANPAIEFGKPEFPKSETLRYPALGRLNV
jgi:hypothetical protein